MLVAAMRGAVGYLKNLIPKRVSADISEDTPLVLTNKDNEETGKLSYEMCATMWGVFDFKMAMNSKVRITLPSYCIAKECRVAIDRWSEEEIVFGDLIIVMCSLHKPIAIQHAKSLGIEVKNPRLIRRG